MIGPIRIIAARPRLAASMLFGVGVGLLLGVFPHPWSAYSRGLIGWDSGCIALVASNLIAMAGRSPEEIRRRAAAQDEGKGLILALVLAAAAVSIGAIGIELSLAKSLHGFEKTVRIGLAFLTVALSWFVVQLIFALHYAHEYYSPAADELGGVRGGLAFPADECPDYWDFLHFAIVIGVASQTADIGFTSKTLRRIGTVHGVIAFVFNTVVLALTINLVAGLF
ncbi:DUF1345 domain-containing protein [Caulobacter sp. S45]|uniref:DUF1345 domain-containing protein n=1 Tax=Caulobacter sp. S45 TaxID=1641861 RepID=UPI001C20AD29|nr:DUF1345 domain-containing protein [Caulobacter sp. S45]